MITARGGKSQAGQFVGAAVPVAQRAFLRGPQHFTPDARRTSLALVLARGRHAEQRGEFEGTGAGGVKMKVQTNHEQGWYFTNTPSHWEDEVQAMEEARDSRLALHDIPSRSGAAVGRSFDESASREYLCMDSERTTSPNGGHPNRHAGASSLQVISVLQMVTPRLVARDKGGRRGSLFRITNVQCDRRINI
jgi:hypothetical protein